MRKSLWMSPLPELNCALTDSDNWVSSIKADKVNCACCVVWLAFIWRSASCSMVI